MASAAYNLTRTDLSHIYETAMLRTQMRVRGMNPDEQDVTRVVITDDAQDAKIVNQFILTGAAIMADGMGVWKVVETDEQGNETVRELSGVDSLTTHGLKDQQKLSMYALPTYSPAVGEYRSALTEMMHENIVCYVLWQWYDTIGWFNDSQVWEGKWRETLQKVRNHSGKKSYVTRTGRYL